MRVPARCLNRTRAQFPAFWTALGLKKKKKEEFEGRLLVGRGPWPVALLLAAAVAVVVLVVVAILAPERLPLPLVR